MKRCLVFAGAWMGLVMTAGAWWFSSPSLAGVSPPTGPIIDLNFAQISGGTVPDWSGVANNGFGEMGLVGSETNWYPTTTADALGNEAVVFDGTQAQRIEIPDSSGSLNVNHFSILVQFSLDESVDTDPAHQRYELMENAGSFWFNVREDTTPKYLLRVGGYFNGTATTTFTGTHPIPDNTLMWAVATYDGAYLRTYIANGDGTNLTLDKSVPQTGTLDTGATITGVDENLVVGAKHRLGAPYEDAEAFFNGTMSRFLVYDTALTPTQISSVIAGPNPSPRPGPVSAAFIQNSAMSSATKPTVPYKVSWTQGTCPAGSTYNLAVTTNGSQKVPYTGSALTATVTIPVGATPAITVNCGEGDTSLDTFTSTGYQESSASYTGTWHSLTSTAAWGGAAKYTAAASASATFHCASCQALAWVTDENSAQGSAKVYVDGVLKATVNTQSSTQRNRVIAYNWEFGTDGAHTLKIVNLATSGHPRITVDGFLTRN